MINTEPFLNPKKNLLLYLSLSNELIIFYEKLLYYLYIYPFNIFQIFIDQVEHV